MGRSKHKRADDGMKQTLMPQWAIPRAVPGYPRRVDAPSIRSQLAALGMEVALRTVQRDLNALACAFPLDSDQSKPKGWYWRQGAVALCREWVDRERWWTHTSEDSPDEIWRRPSPWRVCGPRICGWYGSRDVALAYGGVFTACRPTGRSERCRRHRVLPTRPGGARAAVGPRWSTRSRRLFRVRAVA